MILDLHETLEEYEEVPTLGVVLLGLVLIVLTIGLAYVIYYLGRMALMIFI
ncbi:hypothetical protein [Lactococcus garvieae]|uniref:hypothetical protein n=1 Tax=Lactococcus garvieae TaxID=1363 RepID=UPI0002DB711C|nr:hypothetical protein [Lactococcus garvieae]